MPKLKAMASGQDILTTDVKFMIINNNFFPLGELALGRSEQTGNPTTWVLQMHNIHLQAIINWPFAASFNLHVSQTPSVFATSQPVSMATRLPLASPQKVYAFPQQISTFPASLSGDDDLR